MATIYSKLMAGELPAEFVFTDEHWVAFLDIKPINPGHVLLVPRAEVQYIADLPAAAAAQMGDYLCRLTVCVKRACDTEGVNVLVNDGRQAAQEVPHVHIHIVPRHPVDAGLDFAAAKSYPDDAAKTAMAEALRAAWKAVSA